MHALAEYTFRALGGRRRDVVRFFSRSEVSKVSRFLLERAICGVLRRCEEGCGSAGGGRHFAGARDVSYLKWPPRLFSGDLESAFRG